MTVIKISREINSSIDKLWNIISDIDRDPEYWHGIKSVKTIRRGENIVERESFISFKNSKCTERLTLYDKRKIEVEMLKGPLVGKKTISLEKIERSKNPYKCNLGCAYEWISECFYNFYKKSYNTRNR